MRYIAEEQRISRARYTAASIVASQQRTEAEAARLRVLFINAFKNAVPDLVKVGKEGYIHGYICVRPPCGELPRKIKATELSTSKDDGSVVHEPSGFKIGVITQHTPGAFTAQHGDDEPLVGAFARPSYAKRHIAGVYNARAKKRAVLASREQLLRKPKSLVTGGNLTGHGLPGAAAPVSLTDLMPGNDGEQLRKIAGDTHVYNQAFGMSAEFFRLKAAAMHNIFTQQYHVPSNVASVLSGSSSLPDAHGSDIEKLAAGWRVERDWSDNGQKSWLARNYGRSAKMSVPAVNPGDWQLARSGELRFSDQSPEAWQRRHDVKTYYLPRAQQTYTHMMINEIGGVGKTISRFVFGAQADQLVNASEDEKPWSTSAPELSSWAQPSKRARTNIMRFIRMQQHMTGNETSKVAELKMSMPLAQDIFMHWRYEPQLRDDNLNEVVPANVDGIYIDDEIATVKDVTDDVNNVW